MGTITRLEVENFKRIRVLKIDATTGGVVIGGDNAVGKSSTLDAIQAAMGGKRNSPVEPIRRGSKKASVVLETDDFTVVRKWSKGKSGDSLVVTAKDGSRFSSPQKMLDALVASLSFDPLDFERMKPAQQSAVLRALVGLDFSAANGDRAAAYDRRTEFNREAKRLGAELDGIDEPLEGAPEESSAAELMDELRRRSEFNDAHRRKRGSLVDLRNKAATLRAELDSLKTELAEVDQRGRSLRTECDAMVDADEAEIEKRLEVLEDSNAVARAAARWRQLTAECDAATESAETESEAITKIDLEKSRATAAAEFPIEGLSVTDEGVLLDGLPFEQGSQAQRLTASVAIGLALNPEFPVLLVRDGSRLDKKHLQKVCDLAEAAGAQVWIETVGEGEACTVVIEDGAEKLPDCVLCERPVDDDWRSRGTHPAHATCAAQASSEG